MEKVYAFNSVYEMHAQAVDVYFFTNVFRLVSPMHFKLGEGQWKKYSSSSMLVVLHILLEIIVPSYF